MQGPDDGLRSEVAERSASIRQIEDDFEAESQLEQLLDLVLERLQEDIDGHLDPPIDDDDEAGDALLGAIEQWASLASHAAIDTYAPNSPFPRKAVGFGRKAVKKLRKFSRKLSGPLSAAQNAMGANSYSISVGFPWGISAGLSW